MEIGQVLNSKFTVVSILEVARYGKFFSNRTVKAQFYVRGLRGGLFLGHLFTNGRFKIERQGTETPFFEGHIKYDGETGQPVADTQEVVALLEGWTLKRHGISSQVTVTSDRISFAVKTIYSATTLLREFGRHNVLVTANSVMDYVVEVPLTKAKTLLISQSL